MTKKKNTLFLTLCLILVTMLTSGCFQVKADIEIHEDGSVILNRTMVGNEFLQDEIEQAKKDVTKNSPDAKVDSVSNGNLKGFHAETNYKDIRTMAKDVNLFDAHKGLNNGIQMKKGLLFDSYSLDLIFENNNDNKDIKDLPQEQQTLAKSMLSDMKFDFTLKLPYPSGNTNATKVTNEGKELYWDLSAALIGNETSTVKADFRIWHKDRVIGLAVVALVLLLAMFKFMAKANKNKQNSSVSANAKNLAILCGMLLLILAGGTYYLIEEQPHYTEQDIISDTKDKLNSPKKNKASDKVSEKTTKPADTKIANTNAASSAQMMDISTKPSTETALGPVDLCLSFDQLQGRLGKEEKPSKLDDSGFTHYYYPDWEIIVANGHVESLYSNSSRVQTKRGLRQGDSVQEILQAYGDPYGKTEYNGSTLYEYQFRSINNDNCLLRFAVKNGVIDYIGSRIIR